jgi:protein-L-isoaspartate(D-aspartate) O-methyltransferase
MPMTLEECREFFAQEIRLLAGIKTPRLAEAYARVPREKYLGPPPWQIASPEERALSLRGTSKVGYLSTEDPRDLCHNMLAAIDPAHEINNGQPSALGRWIDAMELKAGDRVYHLGCGVGYYTAIMAEVVGPSGRVVGIELQPELAARAKENLAGYSQVTVHADDGATFDPGDCEAMLINAGVILPRGLWLERLSAGGRLVVPLTMAATPTLGQGVMAKIIREGGKFSAQMITVIGIFSCVSLRDPQMEPLMVKALTTGALLKLKSVRADAHEPSDTCVLHTPGMCLSMADAAAAQEAAAS